MLLAWLATLLSTHSCMYTYKPFFKCIHTFNKKKFLKKLQLYFNCQLFLQLQEFSVIGT